MGSSHLQRIACLSVLLILAVGCSKEDLNNLANKAKNAVTEGKEAVAKNVSSAKKTMGDTTAAVQEKLQMAGSIQLNAGTDFNTQACYASLVEQGSGRPAILQLRSYRDAENEGSPSIFLQAQVRANSAAELKSEPIEARLFVQSQDGNVLFSEADKPVQLRITSVDEKSLKAELVQASLFNIALGESVTATGQFEFELPSVTAP